MSHYYWRDIAGEEMADSFNVSLSRHYAYLNEILVVPTFVHVAMKPFNLLQKQTVVINSVCDNQQSTYATALRILKTNNNASDYHRDKYENVASQLLFRATASASQVPVRITLALIDDRLLANLFWYCIFQFCWRTVRILVKTICLTSNSEEMQIA